MRHNARNVKNVWTTAKSSFLTSTGFFIVVKVADSVRISSWTNLTSMQFFYAAS